MRTTRTTGAVCAALVLLAVAAPARAQDVKVDFDQKFNFASVKTFSVKIASSWGNQLEKVTTKMFKNFPPGSAATR